MSIIEELNLKPTDHVDSVVLSPDSSRLKLTFNTGPDEWRSLYKVNFSGVEKFEREVLDDEEQVGINNFTDLVLEFSEHMGSYYLHLTCTSFAFCTKAIPICKNV